MLDLKSIFDRYGDPVALQRIECTQQDVQDLLSITSQLSITHWSDPNIDPYHLAQIKLIIAGANNDLSTVLKKVSDSYRTHGAVVVSLGAEVQKHNINDVKKALITLLTTLGLPFGAFHKQGIWKTLGVNPKASSLRAESTGYIPLHIDFDQASSPPDGVALFCLRPDPYGGGESIIFDYQRFLDLLSYQEKSYLAGIEYSYSTLYEQNGIGELYNPHPLLDRDKKSLLLRYNGKALPELPNTSYKLFDALETFFYNHSTVFPLKAGDMVIVNQNRTLHGRQVLATRDSASVIKAENDRLLLQTYIRAGADRHCSI